MYIEFFYLFALRCSLQKVSTLGVSGVSGGDMGCVSANARLLAQLLLNLLNQSRSYKDRPSQLLLNPLSNYNRV